MSLENPFSVLFDIEGVSLAVTASTSGTFVTGAGSQPGLLVMGSGSNGAQFLKLASDGALFITGAVTDTIDITGALTITGAVNQGDAGSIPESWFVTITDGTQIIGDSSSTPIWITGSVDIESSIEIEGLTFDGGALVVTGVFDIVNEVDVVVSGANFDSGNLLVALSGVNVTDGALEVTGTLSVTPLRCTTTTVTGFNATTTNITVLPANSDRCGATFFMDGNSVAYVKLGATATATSYTVKLQNNAFFEVPSNYVGQIDVIFADNKSNTLRITEIAE